jgi:aspartyl-tRNA(Asn)/glutamyl-tRNA(Gln) amidotransferase subunit A
MMEALRKHDALVLPTAPAGAFPLGSRTGDPIDMYRSDLLTVPASLAGLPSVSLPIGLDPAGLPLGLQLVGPPNSELDLLRRATALERMCEFPGQRGVPWCR